MVDRHAVCQQIESTGIVAILRTKSSDQLIDVVAALLDAGITCVEVTMTTPGALQVVAEARATFADRCVFGAGTVLDPETAQAAIRAGAQFIVAPTFNASTVALCRRDGVPVLPGCFSPTEILAAHQAGADFIKVFPASALGPGFFKDLRGPLPQLKLVPTGGITPDNAAAYIKAGAVALGMGSALVPPALVAKRDFDGIVALCKMMLETIHRARQSA